MACDSELARVAAWLCDERIERHGHQANVDIIEPNAMGKTEEGRNPAIARAQLRIGQFGIALNLLDHTRLRWQCPLFVEPSRTATWISSRNGVQQMGYTLGAAARACVSEGVWGRIYRNSSNTACRNRVARGVRPESAH